MDCREKINKSLLHKLCLSRVNCSRPSSSAAITYLKPKQVECLEACHYQDNRARDLMAVLATGYGKSLLFELIPQYFDIVSGSEGITIIMSPLNAILDQQMHILGNKARFVKKGSCLLAEECDSSSEEEISGNEDAEKELDKGDFKYLIGHPEDFLDEKIMIMLKKALWNSKVRHIVVDEAHCVVQWGENFRPLYRSIDTLRSLFPQSKPRIIALTATATVAMQKDIARLLDMDSPAIIIGVIDRSNIKYEVHRRPAHAGHNRTVEASYTAVFMPLLKELKEQKQDFHKTVVYTSLKWCGYGNELGVKVLANGEILSTGVQEVAQYHAPLLDNMKKDIADDMASSDGKIRLLLATQAYGMGIDTPDIRRVVHAGAPTTLEGYSQETGRAGRDGKPAKAALFYNREDLGKATVRQDVKEYCELQSCRREFLSNHFGTKFTPTELRHNCCDNCQRQCDCTSCLASEEIQDTIHSDDTHNAETAEEIYTILQECFQAVNSSTDSLLDPTLLTGLTPSLAADVAANYGAFSDTETMKTNYFYIHQDYILMIYDILHQYLND